MNSKWYFIRKTLMGGPINTAELRRLYAEGFFTSPSVLWKEGMSQWENVSNMKDVLDPPKALENTNQAPSARWPVGLIPACVLALWKTVRGWIQKQDGDKNHIV